MKPKLHGEATWKGIKVPGWQSLQLPAGSCVSEPSRQHSAGCQSGVWLLLKHSLFLCCHRLLFLRHKLGSTLSCAHWLQSSPTSPSDGSVDDASLGMSKGGSMPDLYWCWDRTMWRGGEQELMVTANILCHQPGPPAAEPASAQTSCSVKKKKNVFPPPHLDSY